jgi:hypothetical protein
MKRRRGIVIAKGAHSALAGLVCLAVAFGAPGVPGVVATARAGEYHVYACRTPSGGSAPTDGWSGSVEGAYDNYAENTCGKGGALVAGLGDLTTHMATLIRQSGPSAFLLKRRWRRPPYGVRETLTGAT